MRYKEAPVETQPMILGPGTFIDTEEDMKWLREVHLPNLPDVYKSALLFGNEDCPDRIQTYYEIDPSVNDVPAIFVLCE